MSMQVVNVERVLVEPRYLKVNSDGGYQITAIIAHKPTGNELHISAERVVVSDVAHVSPRYERYMVAPRVLEDGHIPTLAQMVADACDWDRIDTPDWIECARGLAEKNALAWLRNHPDIVLAKFGIISGKEEG